MTVAPPRLTQAPAAPAALSTPPPPPPRRRRSLAPGLLLVPSLAVLALVTGWPLVQLLVISLQEYGRAQAFGAPAEFVGIDNYVQVLADPTFWVVLGRSVAFCALNVVATMTLGTLVALLMTKLGRMLRGLVSVGLLLAWSMPALTAVVVWGWMFDTQYGVVNHLLTLVSGTDFTGHSWLIEPLSFFLVATVIITWQSVPFVAFTIYAGLTQVPDEVLEAAQLDGAGPLQRFRFIITPYLRSVFLVLVVLSVIWDLRVFTQIYALQGIGGIREETSTIGVYIYQTSLGTGEYGTGGAIAVLLVVFTLALSWYYVRHTVKEDES